MSKELLKKINTLEKQLDDLKVVIDTAQAALRRADSTIVNEDDRKHIFNQSARWVLSFDTKSVDS